MYFVIRLKIKLCSALQGSHGGIDAADLKLKKDYLIMTLTLSNGRLQM